SRRAQALRRHFPEERRAGLYRGLPHARQGRHAHVVAAPQDADRGRGRGGGLRGATRDGAGAAQRHPRLDLQAPQQGPPSHTARDARRDRGRARGADGARTAMKFSGEITVQAPRTAVYEKVRDARFFASCVDGVRDLVEIGPDRYAAVFETKVAYMKFSFKVT